MITSVLRRRAAVLALALAAALLPPASATAAAPGASAASVRAAAPANSCPRVGDHLFAAADDRVELERITPSPSWRINCKQLYRSDGRPPSVVFEEGFHPKDTLNGQYDIESYVLVNQPSPYVSTTYDHDLYKSWKSGWNYYIDAPGGVDVNQTIGDRHKYASQVEVAFPGGIAREFIVAVCPVDTTRKVEIMDQCEDNPHYTPWRTTYPN
ncbi:ADP-ribosyltransferase [Streptomyces sp. NPDC091268]|uniref:ADP-ribosyltransferase n=1 Tax=Streptomyces sp. NPDC091268 TaxID=3365979 RepID=UPI0037F556CD